MTQFGLELARARFPRRDYAGPVELDVVARPPDRRRRDLDNLLKATLDALVRCHVIRDDSLVQRITIARGAVLEGGALDLRVLFLGGANA